MGLAPICLGPPSFVESHSGTPQSGPWGRLHRLSRGKMHPSYTLMRAARPHFYQSPLQKCVSETVAMENHIKESLTQVELEGRPSELLDDSMKLEHVHQDASKDEMQSISGNVSQEDDLEAEFHLKTWLAVLALFFLNFVQVFALLGPPQVVCSSLSSLYSLEIQAEV